MILKDGFGLALAGLACIVNQAAAWWILGCGQPVVVERIDPIVSPGAVSAHVHTIMGGSAFHFSMTYETTQLSNCTTCTVTADKSNYWVPQLYFHAQNGSFISVKNAGGASVYYE